MKMSRFVSELCHGSSGTNDARARTGDPSRAFSTVGEECNGGLNEGRQVRTSTGRDGWLNSSAQRGATTLTDQALGTTFAGASLHFIGRMTDMSRSSQTLSLFS